MRYLILFFLPTYFLLPEKKVSKEIWHKGDSPYVSPFMLARLPRLRRGRTLLAKVKKHIKDQSFSLSIAVGFVPTLIIGVLSSGGERIVFYIKQKSYNAKQTQFTRIRAQP